MDLLRVVIEKTHRVPIVTRRGVKLPAASIARQLDTTLMAVGFKLSGELLEAVSALTPIKALEIAGNVVGACQQMVGDHWKHNVYFKDFPRNVPDTMEFWVGLLRKAANTLSEGELAVLEGQLQAGTFDLLTLPEYGQYQHTYAQMLEAHEAFVPALGDRVTVLHKGDTLEEEVNLLFTQLISSPVPLSPEDRGLVFELASVMEDRCLFKLEVPVRENRAILNAIRVKRGLLLDTNTPTDILRLAAALSPNGDVTLETNTRFKSFPRKVRKALLKNLEELLRKNMMRTHDFALHREQWKRLAVGLHSVDYPKYKLVRRALQELQEGGLPSVYSRVEGMLSQPDIGFEKAVELMRYTPGILFRSLDRLLTLANQQQTEYLIDIIDELASKVSPRVLLSLREHLQNRGESHEGLLRVFANRKGTAWTQRETRAPIAKNMLASVLQSIDHHIRSRLDAPKVVVFEESAAGLAVPLSDKYKPKGFGIAARGSVFKLSRSIARFFLYWKEKEQRTDYDLSALLLDADFKSMGQVSYTHLRTKDGLVLHSGDITHSAEGASEFIQADLGGLFNKTGARYLVPQVNLYAGENFDTVEEGFFGVMEWEHIQSKGKPFEPRTATIKSELRGKQRVSLPLVLYCGEGGVWEAKWLHLALKGRERYNQLEGHTFATGDFVRSVVQREYLTVDYLVSLMVSKKSDIVFYAPGDPLPDRPVTFVGLERPEGLAKGSEVYTPANLSGLLGFLK